MMKYIFSKGSALMAVVVAALTFSSCEYKDLDDDAAGYTQKTKFTLSFDWDKVDSIPSYMRVVFYPEDISRYAQGYTFFDVLNRDTVIELPAGKYDVTAWNNDTEHNIYSGFTVRESINAATGNYSPHGDVNIPKVLDSLYNGQRILDYPDYMVHANKAAFELSYQDYIHKLVLAPDSMVVTVEVRMHGIAGLEWCRNIRGTINNVAGRRYMAFDNRTDETVAVMFDAQKHTEDSLVTAKFWVYGIEPSDLSSLEHRMIFFFWVTGNQMFIPLDVTKIIARASKDDKYILIETPDLGIDLADYVRQGNTGWSIDTEEWDDVENITLSF